MIIKNNNIPNKIFLIFFDMKKFYFYIQQINKVINIKTYLRKKEKR